MEKQDFSRSTLCQQIGERRRRKKLTTDEKLYLESIWRSTPFPTISDCTVIAEDLGMSAQSVKVWFRNRRIRERKELSGLIEDNKRACSQNVQFTMTSASPRLNSTFTSPAQRFEFLEVRTPSPCTQSVFWQNGNMADQTPHLDGLVHDLKRKFLLTPLF
eukprot:TRINITY_DN8594_c0_g1_i1.p1 TRINITY_DN8594_c0_g1~~TRINITY_DN8594_c0_g1_i1.p1  ORF type:complete len:173 (-),score=49.96 TRINITY_DN8594_c0_g1_i1:65-544(-)